MGSPAIFFGDKVKILNSGGFEFKDGHVDIFGSGTPEGIVTAPPGSIFKDTDDPSSYYLKETGTGNTGWVALAKVDDLATSVEDALTITADGQTAFTLSQTPASSAGFFLFLNGQERIFGTDFTFTGTSFTWLDPGGRTLITTDELWCKYNVTVSDLHLLTVLELQVFS